MDSSSSLPAAPPGERLYAIGDLHGRLDLLTQIVARIKADAAAHSQRKKELIFLGDYIDRGTESRGVIEFLLNGLPEDMEKTFLRGNHDERMLRFLDGDLEAAQDWFYLGGTATLASYGLSPFRFEALKDLGALRDELLEKMPESHRRFLGATTLDCTRGGYYFVHAGIRPGVPLDRQSPEDRMWIRQAFIFSSEDHGKIVVHGHSIVTAPDVMPNRIGIDTGAYATGHLTCLVLQDTSREFLST